MEIPQRDGIAFKFRKNCQAIGRAIIMREIYQLLLFFIIQSIICPTFEEFTYFFLMDVIGVSKFLFSMVVLAG